MLRPGSTLAALCLAVAALLLPSAPAHAEGEAACQWLKIKAAGSGFEIADAGLGPKRSAKALCYAQLVFSAPSADFPYGRYTAPLICLLGANESWGMTNADQGLSMRILADGNAISDLDAIFGDDENPGIPGDDYLTFRGENGDVVQGFASYVLRVSLDKMGAFKHATWKTLGADMIHNSTYFRTPATVFGGYKASGATVPVEKVPEGAQALAAGGLCP